MTVRVALNGFGRIGRMVFRAAVEAKRSDIEFVAINDLGPAESNAHLLKWDSVHGPLPADVSVAGDVMTVNGKSVKVLKERDPTKLPWKELNIDIVAECTGIFTDKEKAVVHLGAGAKRVLVSAPSAGADLTLVYGVNHDKLKKEHLVVSNASCTTNCLAPIAHVLHATYGIQQGYMTTIHAYTGDQATVDTLHKDLRRARGAAISMIPTSTGAAKAVGEVLPELKGKLDGTAIRVPTPNVSVVDFKCVLSKAATEEAINQAMTDAAAGKTFGGQLKGILAVNTLPLVSVDFNHNPASSTFDATQTKVMPGNFIRVLSWYDNEWGFSNRMLDALAAIGKLL